MGVALEIACVALQLRNRSDPAATAMVAEKIIALAKAGERCATTLCDRALSELGYPIVSDPIFLRLPLRRRARRVLRLKPGAAGIAIAPSPSAGRGSGGTH
jgi:hypothetical protein